ncbi:MAG: peptidoglycan DD-metalloendopeptidase family protein [Microbacteriaceae bacterium]|nr:peptidoglycan DD-metalloendopeptidase family protein [Microbacteriaceae bacterium]
MLVVKIVTIVKMVAKKIEAIEAKPQRLTLFAAVLLALSLLILSAFAPSAPAFAEDGASYPTWAEVEKARQNEKTLAAMVTKLENSIAGIKSRLSVAEDKAKIAGEKYAEAQEKVDVKQFEADRLEAQAVAAESRAADSKRRAGLVAAAASRTNGGDIVTNMLSGVEDSANLLWKLGAIDQIGQQSAGIFRQAQQDMNAANSLKDQVDVAKAELQVLADIAKEAFDEAQQAAQELQNLVEETQADLDRMEYQLAQAKKNRQATEDGYKDYIKSIVGSDVQLGSNYFAITSYGVWVRPVIGGYISAEYGNRYLFGTWAFHSGTDISGLNYNGTGYSCNAPIFAASSGTVIYAGWYNGTAGNKIMIDHGNGVITEYNHIVNGGVMVSIGQAVTVGQQIAKVGTTGLSTGCHLHYQVRVNGATTNPIPFMSVRGINIYSGTGK